MMCCRNLEILVDDLRSSKVHELLTEHLQDMHRHSPPESVHALDLQGLRRPEVTFWTAWQGPELLGCGALKELSKTHGEIKSMRTATAHLRKGVARCMLAHMVAEACRRGYQCVSLETGSGEAFQPARRLYETFGFEYCPPFDGYVQDPFSVFMTVKLS